MLFSVIPDGKGDSADASGR